MFSWFKKKKERDFFAQVQSSIKEFEDATNSHMEFMRSHENDINTTTIGSGEVSIETEAPKKSITKNRVLKRDENQGSRVLSILKENPEGLTRYEIKDVYVKQFGDILDTSLSRAIACLSYDTAITMTDITKLERYGKVCHIYKAN
jgi:hypothetical protein